jgi:hypothetical protein
MSGSPHVNLSFYGPVVHKKIFKLPHSSFGLLWLPFLWKGLDPLFEQTWIPFMQELFVPSLIEIDQMLHFKTFFRIYTCKYCFPIVVPPRPRGHNLYKLDIALWQGHFMQIWVILAQRFSRRNSKWPHPIFAVLGLSPLWRGPSLYLKYFEFPLQRWFVPSLLKLPCWFWKSCLSV